ncbi:MAG: sugar phosphate isomerase/epimerase, partial [Planctomycetia bacterium]|nr:sugar phosphate isomerase/epimerase [Planctomycetia bacterium]
RSVVIHLKPGGPAGTPLAGPGDTVDWKRVFNICETTGGTQWYIVEKSPEKGGDSLALIETCYRNLKKLGKV